MNDILFEITISFALPCNVWEGKDGNLYVECCSCGDDIIIDDPEWIEGIGPDEIFEAWCGKSPFCCP